MQPIFFMKLMENKKLKKSGIKVIAGTFLGPFIEGIVFFISAGRIDVPRAWFCLAVSFIGMFGGVVLLWRVNPQLLNHRGEWKKKEGNKLWDKFLLILYGVSGFYIVPAVIGLDVRFQWSYLGIGFAVGGAVLFIAGSVLIHWAMMVNTHFEVTVRVQKDRNHKVITAGPYRVVRHPGYVGVILWLVSFPLMIGSVVGLIPAGFAVLLITIRTLLEDRMLCSELDGYSEYAARVKYRLVPAIW